MSARPSLPLDLLQALLALVEERSVTRAGRRLFLSQPAVSGMLARLREGLGDAVLVRVGNRLEPTARALELAETVRPHLDALAAAVAEARPFDPARDRRIFRLGCTDAVGLAVLPQLGARLRAEAPGADLVVRVGDYRTLPAMLDSGEANAVAGWLRDDPAASARMRVLRHAPWVVLRDAATRPSDDLDGYCARPHALVTPAGDLEGQVDRLLRDAGRTRRVALGVSSFALLLAALPGTDLLATVPDFVAARLAALGGLAVEPCPVAVPPVTNALAWRAATDRDPAERWFRALVTAAFAATG